MSTPKIKDFIIYMLTMSQIFWFSVSPCGLVQTLMDTSYHLSTLDINPNIFSLELLILYFVISTLYLHHLRESKPFHK